jgi:peptidoglycan/LPS O-acetylase OafA/YrhL
MRSDTSAVLIGPAAAPPVEEPPVPQFRHMPALDGLRGVAVLSVVAYHFGTGLSGGFLGVDTFFVLSGFLITSLLIVEWERKGRIDLVAFWIRRARRLLPALLLVLAVVAVWSTIVFPDDRLGGVRSDGTWTLFYGVNWHFIFSSQSYFDLVSEASPLRHAWSLAIEEQFYLVWPLIFVAALKLAKGRLRVLVALSVVGAVASVVVMGVLFGDGDPSRAYYGTDSRAHGLLAGALLAMAITARRPASSGHRGRWRHASERWSVPGWAYGVLGAASVVVMAVMFATVDDQDAWLYPWGFVLFELAVVAVILSVARASATLVSRGLAWRPLCWVGAISYGLYLWHWPVLVFLSEGRLRIDGWQLFVVRTVVTLACALASYHFLEQPIRRGRWLHGKVGFVAAPVAVVLTLGVVLGATRDAAAPPAYLVANPDEVLSLGSDPGPVTDVPPTSATSVAPGAPLPARDVGRIHLIGDSVAASLAEFGMVAYANSQGLAFAADARPGCGLIGGLPGPSEAEGPVAWAEACDGALVEFEQGLASRRGADTIVWMSTWETSDRWVDGVFYEFGTPEADEVVLRLIDEARARVLAGSDAIMVFALQPPNASMSEKGPPDQENIRRMLHLNELLREYSAEHPADTRVLDLSAIVCPGGVPCPETVDGVRPRPADGAHYEAEGATWLAPRFFAEIQRVAS